MKHYIIVFLLAFSFHSFAQQQEDTVQVYKKRVLESAEIDFLTSSYFQDGNNAAVTGGIGSEKLNDHTPTIKIAIPLNDDDVLRINAGISAYSSASSSNLDPFDQSGASGDYEDDDDEVTTILNPQDVKGSPWVASTGASKSDVWSNFGANYSHSSDDRNEIWSANMSFASEFDYTSFGFGGGHTWLFNQKNTEIDLKGNIYFDQWDPEQPTELVSYFEANESLNKGYFLGVPIKDESGATIDKNSVNVWQPFKNPVISNTARNTYSFTFSFSQILSKNAQLSLFFDVVYQAGWLANPMQRIYFKDKANYYIGNEQSIMNYTSSSNTDVFQLADDIERLPHSRLKIPLGARFNCFINEYLVVRTYYRYYFDDWGINSHTATLELPIKLTDKWTITPTYRYYNQTASTYFAPYEEHVSTDDFYTSDYDLSAFDANQYGIGIKYTDIFTNARIWKIGLKSVGFKYGHYQRSTGLVANIGTIGFQFVID